MDKVNNSTGKLKPEHDPNNQRRNMQNGAWIGRQKVCERRITKTEECKCEVGDSEMGIDKIEECKLE